MSVCIPDGSRAGPPSEVRILTHEVGQINHAADQRQDIALLNDFIGHRNGNKL